jgi:hypothetical protein
MANLYVPRAATGQIRADRLIVEYLNLRGLNLAISYADQCGFRYPAFACFLAFACQHSFRVYSLYLSGLRYRPQGSQPFQSCAP